MTLYVALFWVDGAQLSGVKFGSMDIGKTIAFARKMLAKLPIRDPDYQAGLHAIVDDWHGDVLLQPTTDTGNFLLISIDLDVEEI